MASLSAANKTQLRPKTKERQRWSEGLLPAEIVDVLVDTELLAEEIIGDERQSVEFDRKRQKNREALSRLRTIEKSSSASSASNKKVWSSAGDFFIKLPISKAIEVITADQLRLNGEIESHREGVKAKLQKLHEMEGRSTTEIKALRELKALGPNDLARMARNGRYYDEVIEDLPD